MSLRPGGRATADGRALTPGGDRATAGEPGDHGAGRFGLVVANGWLLFLLFPLVTLLGYDAAAWRKISAVVVIAAFGVTHVLAYRDRIGEHFDTPGADAGRTRQGSLFWFVIMVGLTAVGIALIGWPMFGLTPFLMSYAVFNFDWPTAGLVAIVTLAVVVIAPATQGVLGELWFFSLIALSVGAGTALLRSSEEHLAERAMLQTRVALGDERQRVARDIHDVLGHSLTAVILKGQVIDRILDGIVVEPDEAQELLAEAQGHLRDLDDVSRTALAEIRSTVGGLRVAELCDEIGAARAVLGDAGVALEVAGDPTAIDTRIKPIAGWVVRETVTNVVRHAKARTCVIAIGGDDDDWGLRISDDGAGRGDAPRSHGLRGLDERVQSVGALLRIGDASADGSGTMIEVIKPGNAATISSTGAAIASARPISRAAASSSADVSNERIGDDRTADREAETGQIDD